ncbi:MAG: endonuclease/exonuclease/phosphatase family protein [Planctomycetota bacterium]
MSRPDQEEPACCFLCSEARDPGAHTGRDPLDLHCEFELGAFAPPPPPPPERLRVVAWNLERGLELDGQLRFLREDPDVRDADLLLLSEADRGCARTGGRNVTRELAQALGRDYAFCVQYVELPRADRRPRHRVDAVCEHGNAILSRYPLLNPRQLRHRDTARWDQRRDEPRLGGSTSLGAEVEVAGGRRLRCYSVHMDSGFLQDAYRAAQARDLVADADAHEGPVLVGGDMNTFRYTLDAAAGLGRDPTPRVFAAAGFADAHAVLPRWRRGTTSRKWLVRGVIDLVFVRGLRVERAGIARRARGLSDHYPVFAELALP